MLEAPVAPEDQVTQPRRNGQNQHNTSARTDMDLQVLVKNFVLDTNVLLHDPNSPLHFQENQVLLPIEVIEEIDRFKRDHSE
tara:strand:- start:784 stop:1029 length:246 start_codon:yes stop_codon:yes gene_type:complete